MPSSHGSRGRPTAPTGPTRSEQPRSRRKQGREAGRGGGGAAAREINRPHEPSGPYESRDVYGRPLTGSQPHEKRRKIWRVLTHNVTITITAIGGLAAAVMLVDVGSMTGGGKPPKAATAGLSTNDMLARLTGSGMDPVAANSIAYAKERAYKEEQRELKRLKEKAKRDAAAKAELDAKLKAQRERERLARSNPSAVQNKAYGKKMNALKGWGRCWSSLETLWDHESGWNERAENPSSGAYGIPQALPGSKLASEGADWRTSSPTQIAWGLGYIKARYKDPCGAWAWWSSHHWY